MNDAMDDLLRRLAADTGATSTRDRQLSAIAATILRGDADLADALLRDHLGDHPDHVVARWIAEHLPHGTNALPTPHPRKDPS